MGGLGGILGGLGAVLGGLGSAWLIQGHFGVVASLRRAVFWRPKEGQDDAKMRPKTDQNRRQKRRRKKMLLKIVLEPSWGDLGSFWVPSSVPKNVGNIGKLNAS